MFVHSVDWDYVALVEFRARILKKIVGLNANGRITDVDVPGLMVRW